MDFNKLFAGILAAGTLFLGSLIVSETIFAPDILENPSYVIDTSAVAGGETPVVKDNKPAFLTGDAFEELIAVADIAKGEKIIKKCTACHSFNEGGGNKVGPALWGVYNKNIASVDGYSYSDALASLDGAWDTENLNAWLYKPKTFAKGNKMSFAGIKKDADRAALIAYLKTLQ